MMPTPVKPLAIITMVLMVIWMPGCGADRPASMDPTAEEMDAMDEAMDAELAKEDAAAGQ